MPLEICATVIMAKHQADCYYSHYKPCTVKFFSGSEYKNLIYIHNINSNPQISSKLPISVTADNFSSTVWYLPCEGKKKNIQTVKVSLFTCVKITGHELPASFSSSHFSPLHRDRKAAAPIWSHPECNCAIWLWFLYHVPPCSALPVNPYWPVSNLQVSQAFGELPGDKVLFHKSARYIFQLIQCTRDGQGRGWMDWRMRKMGLLSSAFLGTVNIGMPHV